MSKRKWRAKLLNSVIGVVTGALVLLFLLDYSGPGNLPSLSPDAAIATHPQYFLAGAHSVEFNREGQVEFVLTSSEIRHNPMDDSAQLRAPQVELFDAGNREWTIRAHLGSISADGSEIDLQQRVIVNSEDEATILTTPQLLIFPNQKLAKTDKPVTLRNPYGFTRSIGMVADMNRQRVDLLQEVRGQYQGVLLDEER